MRAVRAAPDNACRACTQLPPATLGATTERTRRDISAAIALCSIYGIGRTRARQIFSVAADGRVAAAVKLQELFGLAETPTLGPRRVPVTFSLLAPNGRPVQTTRDLRSFWQGAYQEVRRELRGRYPKHPWPEDPWTAVPTHRTTRALGKTPPGR